MDKRKYLNQYKEKVLTYIDKELERVINEISSKYIKDEHLLKRVLEQADDIAEDDTHNPHHYIHSSGLVLDGLMRRNFGCRAYAAEIIDEYRGYKEDRIIITDDKIDIKYKKQVIKKYIKLLKQQKDEEITL